MPRLGGRRRGARGRAGRPVGRGDPQVPDFLKPGGASAAAMDLYLPVLLGTVREGNRSRHVARHVVSRIEARGQRSRLVDPDELPFGDLRRREWEMEPRPPEVAAFVDDMARADGFVIVSPEYNYGYPGTLKNLLDALYDEWNRKPFGLVGVGGVSGGLRMMDQLRQVVAGLEAVAVPAHVPVQFVAKEQGPDGAFLEPEKWDHRFDKLLEELEWYARALKRAREA